VTTYNPDGTPATPTLTRGIDGPVGVAVDSEGKIYVTNPGNNTLTAYRPTGGDWLLSIGGLDDPNGVAVH